MLALAQSLALLLVCVASAAAQSGAMAAPSTAAAADKAALLELKADWQRGTGASLLSTWSDLSEPCDPSSWHDHWSGWLGVACDGEGGRVAFISLSNAGVAGPVRSFAPLGALRALLLAGNVRITGNVDSLAVLTELRELDLSDTSVHGTPESLATLVHLGQSYSLPRYVREEPAAAAAAPSDDGGGGGGEEREEEAEQATAAAAPAPAAARLTWQAQPGALRLDGSNVYGSVDALRNLTWLGDDRDESEEGDSLAFRACAAFNQVPAIQFLSHHHVVSSFSMQ